MWINNLFSGNLFSFFGETVSGLQLKRDILRKKIQEKLKQANKNVQEKQKEVNDANAIQNMLVNVGKAIDKINKTENSIGLPQHFQPSIC